MSVQLETAIWSIADGRSSDDDVARLHADENASLALLDRLIGDVEESLASARSLPEHERDLVIADLTEERDSLRATAARLRPELETFEFHSEPVAAPPPEEMEPGEVELHASWAAGLLVVWASGRGRTPESHDDLSTRLESIGGPPLGWQIHPSVELPGGVRADALAIPMKDALGWLVAIGGGHGRDGVGAGVIWLGHVALEGVRLAASGSVVPTLRVPRQPQGRTVNAELRWRPALMDSPAITALIAAMPGTVAAVDNGNGQVTTAAVISAVVEAITTESVERMELPAAPPNVASPTDLRDALIAHLDGTPFRAPGTLAADVSRMLDNWTRTVWSDCLGSMPRFIAISMVSSNLADAFFFNNLAASATV